MKKLFFTLFIVALSNWVSAQSVPTFSVERGFFENAFTVTLTATDPETSIYYTTDGSRPTSESTPYTAPIQITTTTPLSAVGIKNSVASAIMSHSYFFIKDIVKQPNNPVGYPSQWGHLGNASSVYNYNVGDLAPADYGMDATICEHPSYKNQINDAFLSIPTISIVTNPGYIFSHSLDPDTGGIYIYTGDSGNPVGQGGALFGDGWERPMSMEYFEPTTGRQFQINCGLTLHGGASRKPENTGKHSFRAYFRKSYGSGKLKFDLFQDKTALKEFDRIVLRGGYNYSFLHWDATQRKNSQYIIDSYAKRTQLGMGHTSGHDRFAHLFINGLYWGVYNITERIDNKFMAAYFKGSDADYDVVKHDGLADGNLLAFDEMVALAKQGKYDELLSKNLLDMENFIDYLLINFYIGNNDWGTNNWYAARNRVNPGKGFTFYCWDSETSMTDVNFNRIYGSNGFQGEFRAMLFGSSTSGMPGGLYQSNEFKLLFADRVQKHFFNSGILTPGIVANLYEKISQEIDLPIILESARWGDYRKNVLPNSSTQIVYTHNDHWVVRKNSLLANYFPNRTAKVYTQLKDLGLASAIDVPVITPNGGNINTPTQVSITALEGNIYFTTDGTDPREKGTGSIAATASQYMIPLQLDATCTVKARAKNGDTWSALSEVAFFRVSNSAINEASFAGNKPKVFEYNQVSYIYLPEAGNYILELYSLNGMCVKRINSSALAGNNPLKLSHIPSGVYIYKAIVNGTTYSGKFKKD